MSNDPQVPAPPTQWSALELTPSDGLAIDRVTLTVSPDGGAGSILFQDELQVTLDQNDAQLARLRVVSLGSVLTPPPGKRVLGFRTEIRGAVFKSKGARVLLSLDLGGKPQVWEIPYGKEHGKDGDSDFLRSLSRKGKAVIAYSATVVMWVERLTPEEDALLQIDSLDVMPIFG